MKSLRLVRAASSLALPAAAALLAASSAEARAEVVITQSFTPNLNVPDLGFVTDTRSLNLTLDNISHVGVSLDIRVRGTGGFAGELIATLLHGDGQAVLLNQSGRHKGVDDMGIRSGLFGYADSGGFNVTFDDSAARDIHTYQNHVTPASGSAVTGVWQPSGRVGMDIDASSPRNAMLGAFDGLSSSGDWSMVVEDTGFGDTLHRFNGWTLQVTGTPGASPTTLRDGATVTGGGDTFHGAVTLEGNATFSGSGVRLDGGLALGASSELKVDGSVRVGGTISEGSSSSGITKLGTGTLTIDGAATHTDRTTVREGTLVVDGTITSSTTTVETGAVIKGTGTLANLELRGGLLSPGHSPGTLTTDDAIFGGGSGLLWEINDAHGAAGADPGWDFVQINGDLEITASTTDKFLIILQTLTTGNASGLLDNFDPGLRYNWNLAQVAGNITGFSPDAFGLDTDGFENAFDGSFSIGSDGGFLTLSYTPVPEPAETAAVIAALLGAFAAFRRKRASRLSTSNA